MPSSSTSSSGSLFGQVLGAAILAGGAAALVAYAAGSKLLASPSAEDQPDLRRRQQRRQQQPGAGARAAVLPASSSAAICLGPVATVRGWTEALSTQCDMAAMKDMYIQWRAGGGEDGAADSVAAGDIGRDVHRTRCPTPAAASSFQAQLRRVLLCISVLNEDVGYVQGLNFITAFALQQVQLAAQAQAGPEQEVHSEQVEAEAFAVVQGLLHLPSLQLRAVLASSSLRQVQVLSKAIDALVERHLPDTAAVLSEHGVHGLMYYEWWLTLLTYTMPWDETLANVWLRAMQHGWPELARAVLALLDHATPFIQEAHARGDATGVLAVLKAYGLGAVGRNAAATPSPAPSTDGDEPALQLVPPPDFMEQLVGVWLPLVGDDEVDQAIQAAERELAVSEQQQAAAAAAAAAAAGNASADSSAPGSPAPAAAASSTFPEALDMSWIMPAGEDWMA